MRKSPARNGISVARSNVWRAAASMASSSRSGRPSGGIDDLPTEIGPLGRHHQLLAVCRRVPANSGAQALVAAHHIVQRRAQRVDIKAPAQPQRHRHVVDR